MINEFYALFIGLCICVGITSTLVIVQLREKVVETGETIIPTRGPTNNPSEHPSWNPTRNPSEHPSWNPTSYPSEHPSWNPTRNPSEHPSIYTLTPTHNYHVKYTPLFIADGEANWWKGGELCWNVSRGSQLAIIYNQTYFDEASSLIATSIAPLGFMRRAWINLTDVHEEGVYRYGLMGDNELASYYQWCDGIEPDSVNFEVEDCIYMHGGKTGTCVYKYHTLQCNINLVVSVCQGIKHGLLLLDGYFNYYEANQLCMNEGGYLVRDYSPRVHEHINHMINTTNYPIGHQRRTWIGVYESQNTFKYTENNYNLTSYKPWCDSQPSLLNECVYVHGGIVGNCYGKWHSLACTTKLNLAVCSIPIY